MPPRWMYPLLPYRSMLYPIVVLCLVVVPCWVAFRLHRRRRTGHHASFGRELLLLIFVGYLAGLAAVTLAPNRSARLRAQGRGEIDLRPSVASLTCSSASLRSGTTAQSFCVRNARGNFLLFVPLGLLIPLVWSRIRFWRGIQIAMVVSLSIELLQYLSSALGSYRAADVNDFILNVLGAGVGLAVVTLLRWRPSARGGASTPG